VVLVATVGFMAAAAVPEAMAQPVVGHWVLVLKG
jgi:hypothetical protein